MVVRVWRSSNERSWGPDVQVTSATDQPWPEAKLRPTARPASPRSLRRCSACCNATAIFAKTYLRLRSTIPTPKNGAPMSTTTAVALESRVLSEGYGAGAWHGPDMKAALADVTPALALHHAYFVRSVRSQISGRPAEPFVLPGEDWFAVTDQKPISWSKVQSTLESEQQRLAELVAAIEAGTVTPAMPAPERFSLILGITCHAIYHAGQVQLIKRLKEA